MPAPMCSAHFAPDEYLGVLFQCTRSMNTPLVATQSNTALNEYPGVPFQFTLSMNTGGNSPSCNSIRYCTAEQLNWFTHCYRFSPSCNSIKYKYKYIWIQIQIQILPSRWVDLHTDTDSPRVATQSNTNTNIYKYKYKYCRAAELIYTLLQIYIEWQMLD